MDKTSHPPIQINAQNQPDPEELQEVKDVLASFITALKNYTVYPEGHKTIESFYRKVQGKFHDFLAEYGILRLDITMDGLLYKGTFVYNESESGEHLAPVLFRDGLQWIEFHEGIEPSEIKAFIRIFNEYKIPVEDPEGDIVTALWEENLSSIYYQSLSAFDKADLLPDVFSSSNAELDGTHFEEDDEVSDDNTLNRSPSNRQQTMEAVLSGKDSSVLEVTAEEKLLLQEMVAEDKTKDNVREIIDVVMVLLEEEGDDQLIREYFTFLQEVFRNTLETHEFIFAYDLLRKIIRLHKQYKNKNNNKAIELISEFIGSIAGMKVLDVLPSVLNNFHKFDKNQIAVLTSILSSLPAKAVLTLGGIFPEITSEQARQMLVELIGRLSRKSLPPLLELLQEPEEELAPLVHILGDIKNKRCVELLRDKMLIHSSRHIRRAALRGLIKQGFTDMQVLFPLIDDDYEPVREHLLTFLGKQRNQPHETLLRDYLEKQQFKIKDDNHIISCYKALGNCGSDQSVPFLTNALKGTPWKLKLSSGAAAGKQGAALALAAIDTEASRLALEEASKGVFPNIKKNIRPSQDGQND